MALILTFLRRVTSRVVELLAQSGKMMGRLLETLSLVRIGPVWDQSGLRAFFDCTGN